MSSVLNHVVSKIAILDPAIFDLDILTTILEDLRPFFRPDPQDSLTGELRSRPSGMRSRARCSTSCRR